MKKVIKIGIPILIIILAAVFWWRYYFVFGEGVKAGNLNFVVRKGYIFKTWEGRLIQQGFKTPTPNQMQSNEFEFSIAEDSLAHILERYSGRFVELRYKEYLNAIPWRGNSNFVVTEILQVEEPTDLQTLPY
ncbi:MAG TPA: hypothetical protein PK073_03875 [Ignavibacteriaceae bacterium]|jgi:hypothetical protein|nr:MAG: hypothetical protein BWY38_02757 [Ignavibacteria bacterium ADurb.Bin266]OQY72884.1 MAG: hypothetical protein B6D44_08935 [Ignavibacteriales bacterium UTCHB2]HQF42029.1 hypothetical protein [Ignavibacteriaceae bacterium]HQI42155.1 hypothetical protein [Ignavibacteriaceae bacterium]HQJ45764.1 hypothetical protein [Ignavibacteriaceae bacterium]